MSRTGKLALIGGVCLLAYLPFLSVPLISDDYIQLLLGRQYGPLTGWPALFQDVLYRCRATSVLVTFALDSLLGADPTVHRAANLLLHFFNVALVMLFGAWSRIGWRVSVPAAAFFAIHEGHQEAVVWSAALPELLVFLFGAGALWLWIRQERPAAFAAFILALFSKESAVALVPVIAWFWWREQKRDAAGLPWLAAMALLSLAYAALIFSASSSHLHLNDAGTFSLRAPFLRTLAISSGRLLWFWGGASLLLLLAVRKWRGLAMLALGWILVTLLPYCFLTYMDRVPSRHTYLASAGLALLVGAAFVVCQDWFTERYRTRASWAAAALALMIAAHNIGYLWVKKLGHYYERAAVTERFLEEAGRHSEPIAVSCGAYPIDVYRASVIVRLGESGDRVLATPDARQAVNYCDPLHP